MIYSDLERLAFKGKTHLFTEMLELLQYRALRSLPFWLGRLSVGVQDELFDSALDGYSLSLPQIVFLVQVGRRVDIYEGQPHTAVA